MLSFHQHEWLLRHGASRINAWLDPRTTSTADIAWDISLRYTAGGAPWRRVEMWHRPSVELYLHQFDPEIRSWRDLEQVDFWDLKREPALSDGDDWSPSHDGLLVGYHNPPVDPPPERMTHFDFTWRVAARDGALFTIELAADSQHLRASPEEETSLVLPAGTPDDEGTSTFWKNHAPLYLIEQIPFGLVTVQVSRNARDPVQQALGRARSLLGLGEPEQIEVADYAGQAENESISGDFWVELHYHSYYED